MLNANGLGTVFPVSALSRLNSTVINPAAPPPVRHDPTAAEAGLATWVIPKIGIVSVGGIGNSNLPTSVQRLRGLPYLSRTVAVHDDCIALQLMRADCKVLLGGSTSLPTPHRVQLVARPGFDEIAEALAGLDMVLLIAYMGCATGTGLAPVVAEVLRDQDILTLAFAVMPLACEGVQKQQAAQTGIRELRPYVDALITCFTDVFDPDTDHVRESSPAAQQAQRVFKEVCSTIMTLVCRPGLVNIDFEDLRHIILNQEGDCAFGFGSATSREDVQAAALRAIDHPMLGRDRMQQTSAALVSIGASLTVLTLRDISSALKTVREQLPADAWVMYGAHHDPSLGDAITVSILANGQMS
jgi:cell division protein FtsZ